jgi:hypothetical protein
MITILELFLQSLHMLKSYFRLFSRIVSLGLCVLWKTKLARPAANKKGFG